MTVPVFWTAHLTTGGGEDHFSVYDDTREVIITAVSGDVYVSPYANSHPPALDTMSSADHWTGAVVMEGQTRRFRIRDIETPDSALYVGTCSPGSGAATVSVICPTEGDQ